MQIKPAISVVISERSAEAAVEVAAGNIGSTSDCFLAESARAIIDEQVVTIVHEVARIAEHGDIKVRVTVIVDVCKDRCVGLQIEAVESRGN